MRNLFFLVIIIGVFNTPPTLAQNHIDNGDFETSVFIPSAISQIHGAATWKPVSITADYFYYPQFYNIQAHSGNGYAGMGLWTVNVTYFTFESFGQKLKTPIQKDKNYYFQAFITQANFSTAACAEVELFGFNALPTIFDPQQHYIGDHPDAVFLGATSIINTTDDFKKYETCFTAPDNFSHLILSVSRGSCNSYLYLDDLKLFELEDLKLFGEEIGICDDETIFLGVDIQDANYVWQDGSSEPTFKVTEPGEYWVSIDTVCGLMMADTITVRDDRLFLEDDFLGNDTTFCNETEETFQLEVPQFTFNPTYTWSTGETTNPIEPTESNVYGVTVQKNNCTATDSVTIQIQNCTICEVFFPNAFTPGYDGINDLFLGKSNCNVLSYELQIFDRWGNLVWENNNIEQGWNGRTKNNKPSQGVYVYQASFTVEEFGEIISKSTEGVVMLLIK